MLVTLASFEAHIDSYFDLQAPEGSKRALAGLPGLSITNPPTLHVIAGTEDAVVTSTQVCMLPIHETTQLSTAAMQKVTTCLSVCCACYSEHGCILVAGSSRGCRQGMM